MNFRKVHKLSGKLLPLGILVPVILYCVLQTQKLDPKRKNLNQYKLDVIDDSRVSLDKHQYSDKKLKHYPWKNQVISQTDGMTFKIHMLYSYYDDRALIRPQKYIRIFILIPKDA